MTFSAELNAYCAALGCTSRELAESSGISASTLSRYRSGKRTPNAAGEPVRKLAAGIARMAEERDVSEVGTEQDVLVMLTSGLQRGTESFSRKLDSIMRMLGISNVEMSRHSNVDPSYLSRIRNGKRSPAEPQSLAESCAEVIVRHAQEKGLMGTLSFLTGEEAAGVEDSTAATVRWLLDDGAASTFESGRGDADVPLLDLVVRFESGAGTVAGDHAGIDAFEVAALTFANGAQCVPGIALRMGLSDDCVSGSIAARRTFLEELVRTVTRVLENTPVS